MRLFILAALLCAPHAARGEEFVAGAADRRLLLDARREARAKLDAERLKRSREIRDLRQLQERERAERKARTNPIIGKTAALLQVCLLGSLAVHLRRKE